MLPSCELILHIFITVLIYSCVLGGNILSYLPLHNGMASVKKKTAVYGCMKYSYATETDYPV